MQIVFYDKTRLGNTFHFKYRISRDLTFGVVHKVSVDSTVSPIKKNVLDTWIQKLVNLLVYHHLPKNKLSLRTAP